MIIHIKTGEAIPVNVIGKLLNALQSYRISYYSLKDRSFSTHVVSSSTKRHIIKHLVTPQDEYMAILGSFKKHGIRRRAKDALSDRLKLMDQKKATALDEAKSMYIRNEATGHMIKVKSRKYKVLFSDAKKSIGKNLKKYGIQLLIG